VNPAAAQNFRDIEVRDPVKIVDGTTGESYLADLNPDRVDYITDEGVEVWLERPAKGTRGEQRTRFVDRDGNQVGPIHVNLYPAIVYASYYGWRDPSMPKWAQDASIREVRANTTKHPGGAGPDWHPSTDLED
jgi:hypothetical protein